MPGYALTLPAFSTLAVDGDKLTAPILPGDAPMVFGGKVLNEVHQVMSRRLGCQSRAPPCRLARVTSRLQHCSPRDRPGSQRWLRARVELVPRLEHLGTRLERRIRTLLCDQ